MTDREMLELAAKAAGMDWCAYYPDKLDSCDLCLQPNGLRWNPLTDDGDALRLSVKLRLEIEWWKNGVSVGRDDMPPSLIEHTGQDEYAATRRAIVRAAAEIGKSMKDNS